jgi:hypothetical protein
MTNHEHSEKTEPNGIIKSPELRSYELAADYANKAREECNTYLQDAIEAWLISCDFADKISYLKEVKAFNIFMHEREVGLRNDTQSMGKGLRVRLTGTEDVLGAFSERLGYPDMSQTNSPRIPRPQEEYGADVFDKTQDFYLPEAGYCDDGTGIHICTQTELLTFEEPHIMRLNDSTIPFFDFMSVVRIEGYNGELWQNPEYTPDGSDRLPGIENTL